MKISCIFDDCKVGASLQLSRATSRFPSCTLPICLISAVTYRPDCTFWDDIQFYDSLVTVISHAQAIQTELFESLWLYISYIFDDCKVGASLQLSWATSRFASCTLLELSWLCVSTKISDILDVVGTRLKLSRVDFQHHAAPATVQCTTILMPFSSALHSFQSLSAGRLLLESERQHSQ